MAEPLCVDVISCLFTCPCKHSARISLEDCINQQHEPQQDSSKPCWTNVIAVTSESLHRAAPRSSRFDMMPARVQLWRKCHNIQSTACLGTERRVVGAEPLVVDGFLDEAQQEDRSPEQWAASQQCC